MKLFPKIFLLCALPGAVHALSPNEWHYQQTVTVPAAGLVRVNIPAETLDAARPDLADLRLLDGSGAEVPFVIERSTRSAASTFRPKEFRPELSPGFSRLTIATGSTDPVRGLNLETAGRDEFIKSVRIEGSHNGSDWRELSNGQPIFRTRTGADNLHVSFPPAAWEFLRLSIDDSKSAPIPFTGASMESGGVETPVEPLRVTIKSRDESPGQTRIALNLGAANTTPAFLRLETPEHLFTRAITIAVPVVTGDEIKETPISATAVYRVELNGKDESRLEIPIDVSVPSREILLLIENGDSPPLALSRIDGQRRLVELTFLATAAGQFQLLSGNKQCAAPNYDLSALSSQLKKAAANQVRPSPLVATAEYQPATSLAGIGMQGGPIDVRPWRYRKRVETAGSGARQIELDPSVLAGAEPNLRDLRLVRGDRQVPFVLERTSISRAVSLTAQKEVDQQRPTVSRWTLKLPKAGLPIQRLVVTASPGIFQRDAQLFERVTSEHGENYARALASARWQQTPEQTNHDYVLNTDIVPETGTLVFETENGDNSPVEFTNFRAFYPVTRVVFVTTAESNEPIWLYYGNPEAAAPRYDVNLVAGQLLSAERESITAGLEENVRGLGRVTETLTGAGRYIFWGVLALAVITLLAVISKLLPKTA